MAMPNYRILLVGDDFVGKTAIMKRFCTGQCTDEYVPTAGPFSLMRENFIVNGSPCTVVVCEMNLNETYKKADWIEDKEKFFDFSEIITKMDAILMVYSFDHQWWANFTQIWDLMRKMKEIFKEKQPVFMLVVNKCDLADAERKVSTEAKSCANLLDLPFKEVSARENINIDSTFATLVEAIQQEKNGMKNVKKEEGTQ